MTRWRTPFARGGATGPLVLAAVAGAAMLLPHASDYALRVVSLAGIYALLTLGYNFIFGLAGALSLAQGAFMGLGAYVSGIFATRYGIGFGAALAASIGLPVLAAALIAMPVLRLQSHYFALATLLVAQALLLLATQWQGVTGGANGIANVPALALGAEDLSSPMRTVALVWACVALGAIGLHFASHGRLGGAFAVLRVHPGVARAIGLDVGMLRFGAFLASAAYAGLAGSLYIHVLGVLSPDVLGFPIMVACLTMSVVGGRRRVVGAILGALLLTALPEWVRGLQDDATLAYGVLLLAVVVVMPDGLIATLDRLLAHAWQASPRSLPAPERLSLAAMEESPGPMLEVRQLSRSFGGVRALQGVSLRVAAGEILGLIGPNGSGKTSLVNAVTGLVPAEAGEVLLAGRRITRWTPHRIARLGIARSFQTPALVGELSVLDNVAVAIGGSRARGWAQAMGWLQRIGAAAIAASPAAGLPPGQARLVEVARALATRPRVILLDEPAAGLNESEQAELAQRLRGIAADGVALLVIEHNMPFLLPIADRLVCMDAGQVIAEGTPQVVQADLRVVEAYLGTPARLPAP